MARLTLGGGGNRESLAVFDFVCKGGIHAVVGAATLVLGFFDLITDAAILVRVFFDFVVGGGIGTIVGAATLIPILVFIIVLILTAVILAAIIFIRVQP